jgi:hypothetical protein
MKFTRVTISALVCLASAGCVAGPGGSYNAANRTITGIAIGTLLGAGAGQAAGNPMTGALIGAIAGGGMGAMMNPNMIHQRDTRGYCYTVDAQGQPIMVPIDSVECKAAAAQAPAAQPQPQPR